MVAITIWIISVYAAIWVRGTISAMTRGFVSLALDMLLAEEGWKQGGHNPFLLGY